MLTRRALPARIFSLKSVVEAIYWANLVFSLFPSFNVPLRWDIFVDPTSAVRPLRYNEEALGAMISSFDRIAYLNRIATLYVMLHGISIILMLARTIKLTHFQARLGIVSRTIATAAGDMGHYLAVLVVMFICCSWCVRPARAQQRIKIKFRLLPFLLHILFCCSESAF